MHPVVIAENVGREATSKEKLGDKPDDTEQTAAVISTSRVR